MTQKEIVTKISKSLYKEHGGYEFRLSEILGFVKGRADTFISNLSARNQYKTLTNFTDAVKETYRLVNPNDYNLDTVVVWIYVEEHRLETLYIGFSRNLTNDEWENIRRMLKVSFVEIKDGQFGILNF
jgi:hypothetical protein